MKKITNDGKRGGNLVGKPHKDKSGKDVGGIKAVVTDAGGTPVELEGGEVIINKAASKKHWKLLSKINQSAGNGVPINKPIDPHDDDPNEEYERGGIIDFNVNDVPNKWIIKYAKKIKEKHPEVWKLGGNIFGNEAFKNLSRVSERGYWLDSEEWMYKKWQSFLARHQHDFRIAGVIAMLKWAGKVNKGWAYMKDLIEAEIQKREGKKKKAKFNDGGSIEEDCIEFIKKSASIKTNGHYLHIKNLNIFVGAGDNEVPNVQSLLLITYNSGGQSNLKASETINASALSKEISKLIGGSINVARIIVSEQIRHAKRFSVSVLNGLENENIIVADRDRIVCTNLMPKYDNGGSVNNTNLPKVGSEVRARWNDTMKWSLGIFKGETENGFEVYDFGIEKPRYIEYYGQISLDPYSGSEIFKSNNFKERNYKNYHFNKEDENYADGGSVDFENELFDELAQHDAPSFAEGGNIDQNNYFENTKADFQPLSPSDTKAILEEYFKWRKKRNKPEYIEVPTFGKLQVNFESVNRNAKYKSRGLSFYFVDEANNFVIRISDHWSKSNYDRSRKLNCGDIASCYWTNFGEKFSIRIPSETYPSEMIGGKCEFDDFEKRVYLEYGKGGNAITYKQKFNRKYGFDKDESHSLAEISKLTKIKLSALQDIYDKGIGAYKTNPQSVRPNVKSKEQWAMARVYSAVMGGKAARVDANELERGRKYHLGGNMKKHLAPNGKPSNLTHEQWHLVRTPEFKAWFGDWENDPENSSKVVDANGEPLVCYHGTYVENPFYIFDFEKADLGFHFGTYEQAKNRSETKLFFKGRKSIVNSFFLNIKTIFEATDVGEWEYPQRYIDMFVSDGLISESDAKKNGFYRLIQREENKQIREYLLNKYGKFVGFVYNNKYEGKGKSFIVLSPNQIKLADGSNTTFDGSNADIRYADGGNMPPAIEEQKPSLGKRAKDFLKAAITPNPKKKLDYLKENPEVVMAAVTRNPRYLMENGGEVYYTRTYSDGRVEKYTQDDYENNILPFLPIQESAITMEIGGQTDDEGNIEMKEGGSVYDPFTDKEIKKIYVSIRIKNEIGQKIIDNKAHYGQYEIKSVEEKPFTELQQGTLNGILGVSGSSYNISDWLSHRNCLVLMNVNNFVEINNTEQVRYNDVDYLMKNNLNAFFRMFDRKEKGEQEYEDVLSNIFKHLTREFELEAYTSPNSKALYYYSLISNPYISSGFLRWLVKQNRVSSPEELEQHLYQYVTDGSGDSDYNFWQSPSKEAFDGTKDEVVTIIRKAILSAASAYRDESEWLMIDAKLNVPKGSQLFFVLGSYENYQEKYEEMISKYNLRDRYKIYFVRQKDIDKYQQLSWNKKDVRYKKENENLKNMVDNKMLKAFDDVINQILDAYEKAVWKAADNYGFNGNLLENEQIIIMYNAYIEKFFDILEQSKKEASITLSKYAFIFAVDNFKQYLRDKASELQEQKAEIVDEYGDSPYISSIIRSVFADALYDVPIDEIAQSIKAKIGSDLYRVYQAKDIRFKKGGNLKSHELAKGIKAEMEHKDTIENFKKQGITNKQVAEAIAKDHLKEDSKYYTKLMNMEKNNYSNGGGIDTWENIAHDFGFSKSKNKYGLRVYLRKGGYAITIDDKQKIVEFNQNSDVLYIGYRINELISALETEFKNNNKYADGGSLPNMFNSQKFVDYQNAVASNLMSRLSITFDDAKNIVTSNDYFTKEAIRKGWAYEETAKRIANKTFRFKDGGNLEQKIKSKLNRSFALPFELAVYVPSTEGADTIISDDEFADRVDEVEIFLSNLFGGFSKSDIDGGYISSEKGLITENVAKVTAFGQQDGFEEKLPILIDKISEWCVKWTQESMGFEFEGDLFYVEKGFKYKNGGSINSDKAEKVRKVMHEFKMGNLHIGKSDKIVTDKQQAIAIALSEAGLSKKRDGGNIEINSQSNMADYISKLVDSVTTLPIREPLVKKEPYTQPKLINFDEPININQYSRVFINSEIYTSEADYIIGGFVSKDLNDIEVVGNGSILSMRKIEILVEQRVRRMIEDFKTEVSINIAKNDEEFDTFTMETDIVNELDNLLKTYLGINVFSSDTNLVAEQIIQHESFKTWQSRIEKRIYEYQNEIVRKPNDVNNTSNLNMQISDIEEITYDATLEQLLEKLAIITEYNEQ